MSRLFLGAACAVLLVGLTLNAQLGAQEGDDLFAGTPAVRNTVPGGSVAVSAEERIDAVLNAKLKSPLEFVDTPLNDIVNYLQDEYDIPILLDTSALDEVAISPNTEISVSLRNIALRSALDLMFKQPGLEDLTYIIDEEVLLITTEDRANETLEVKVYRVDDFEHFDYDEKLSKESKPCYRPVPLIKAIAKSVEYDSWQDNGTGEGTVLLMKPGMLVVSQTRAVHRKIEDFLDKLRAVKAEIEGDESGSNHSGSGRF